MRRIIGILFVIVSTIILIVFNQIMLRERVRTRDFIEITAVVVEHRECLRTDEDSGYTEAYVAEYEVDNIKYRMVSETCSTHNKDIGSEVKIKYNPQNPYDAVDTFDEVIWLIVLNVMCILFIIGGSVMLKKDPNN